jgi:hypothetical protein
MCPVNVCLYHTNKPQTDKKIFVCGKIASKTYEKVKKLFTFAIVHVMKRQNRLKKVNLKNLIYFRIFLIIKQANFVLTLNKPLESIYANIFNRGKRVKNLYSCQTQAPNPTAEYRQ